MKITLKETIRSLDLKIDNNTAPLKKIIEKLDEEVLELVEEAEIYSDATVPVNLTNFIGEMLDVIQMLIVLNSKLMQNVNYKKCFKYAYKKHLTKYSKRGWETGNEIKIIMRGDSKNG